MQMVRIYEFVVQLNVLGNNGNFINNKDKLTIDAKQLVKKTYRLADKHTEKGEIQKF